VADFLGVERLSLGPWQAFERGIERLLVHAGFMDVHLVGRAGDEGADIVAEHNNRTWVVQAKFRSSGQLVVPGAVDEVTVALDRYGGQVAVVATNSGFSESAILHAKKRSGDIGVPFYLWNGDILLDRFRRLSLYPHSRDEPRPYQSEAITALNEQIVEGNRVGLLLMATGLGKTRVAAGVIEQWLLDHPSSECLLLSPSLALVPQLELALWPYLPKTVATHVLTGGEKPTFEGGITVATEQSMINLAGTASGKYGLVIVDEAHHAPADGYRRLLEQLKPLYLLGMTATPWRGDERRVHEIFGDPLYTLSMVEGMQLGYLAQVDYRMLLDDIDWDWLNHELKGQVTVKELNRRLFIPERDEAVVAKIREHLAQLGSPRCVIFCRSIQHAESIGALLRADGIRTRVVHSNMDRKETTRALHDFRTRAVPVVVTVDMLNEGIDIPDVNLIVFLRVTHSRRIFIQQLGRGLRVAPGKKVVRVLDFVSDIRRVAEALHMNEDARESANRLGAGNALRYPTGDIVKFEGDKSLSLFKEYLSDVAELSDDEQVRLRFP
jgi:superfamily II DNA or RNA helicase